jgi:hypothetical protein
MGEWRCIIFDLGTEMETSGLLQAPAALSSGKDFGCCGEELLGIDPRPFYP